MASDPRALAGIGVMAVLACLAGWRWSHTGQVFFLLLLFRDVLWCGLFLTRRPNDKPGASHEAFVAYLSTALPLFYFAPDSPVQSWRILVSDVLAVIGLSLATLATIELGPQIGIVPAFRGKSVNRGIYRWVRHPMYIGYITAELGWILIWPTNAVLYLASSFLYVNRMTMEDRTISRGLRLHFRQDLDSSTEKYI
jgi:protein-S-isoprenylcysteine O-methyltransferase Ste14